MSYLIKEVQILDLRSEWHQKIVDVLIIEGKIEKISTNFTNTSYTLPQNTKTISGKNKQLSIGWFDMRCFVPDPGEEHKETLETARKSALQGGFTGFVTLPNTHPTIQTKESLAYMMQGNKESLVQIYPMASVTLGTKGENLTDMIDLHIHGAVAFSEGSKALENTDILLKTLQYLQKFDGLLINKPEEKLLTQFANMHEGIYSTMLGMKGIPSIAEEMMIERDLRLLEYAGGKIHFTLLSSINSVELVRNAQKKSLKVSTDIAAHQIAFTDESLLELDTKYKVNPPFRTQEDIEALWQGIEDNTIEVIVSDHNPQDTESKNLEFDLAEFGAIGLETLFAVINTYNEKVELAKLIDTFSYNPRKILGIETPRIAEGEKANLTLFDTNKEWIVSAKNLFSKSKNTPFLNQKLKGKAIAVWNNDLFYEIKD